MRHVLTALVGAGAVLVAGCITEEMMDPEYSMYGRFKADVAYNSEQTEGGTAFVWAVPQTAVAPAVDLGDEFQMSALDSRIIAQLGDPGSDDLSGKIEVLTA